MHFGDMRLQFGELVSHMLAKTREGARPPPLVGDHFERRAHVYMATAECGRRPGQDRQGAIAFGGQCAGCSIADMLQQEVMARPLPAVRVRAHLQYCMQQQTYR